MSYCDKYISCPKVLLGFTEGSLRNLQMFESGFRTEAATRCVLCKKMFLEISQNSQENTCARVSFLIKFIKKETVAQAFSCEFCEISKNNFLTEHFWTTFSIRSPEYLQ